jgi:hypothetical protein
VRSPRRAGAYRPALQSEIRILTLSNPRWELSPARTPTQVACTDDTSIDVNQRDLKTQWPIILFCWSDVIVNVIRELKLRRDVHAIVAMIHWGGTVRYDQGGDRYARLYPSLYPR